MAQWKESLEVMELSAKIGFFLSAAIGGLVTFWYLMTIRFFPSGVGFTDLMFLVFVAFASGVVYMLLVSFATMSAIWIVASIAGVSRVLGSAAPASGALFLRDPMWIGISVLVFAICTLMGLANGSGHAITIAIAIPVVGFIEALFLSALIGAPPASPFKRRQQIWLVVLGCFPLFVFSLVMGWGFLPEIFFSTIGVREKNVTIELSHDEVERVINAAEVLQRPLVDCRATSTGKALVHGVNVLWNGVGERSFVELTKESPDDTLRMGGPAAPLKRVALVFDAKQINVIRSAPLMSRCIVLPDEIVVRLDSSTLAAAPAIRLEQIAQDTTQRNRPTKIEVHAFNGYAPKVRGAKTDATAAQLSEARAQVVGEHLQRLYEPTGAEVTWKGEGDQFRKPECDAKLPKAAIDLCHQRQNRIEVTFSFDR